MALKREGPPQGGPRGARQNESIVRRAGYMPTTDPKTANAAARKVINQDIRSLDARTSPTILDLRAIPTDATDEYLIDAAARWLGKLPHDFDAEHPTSKELFNQLNTSFRLAHDYLRSILHCEQYLRPKAPEVHSKEDLIALLRQTAHLHTEVASMAPRAMYCALVLTAFAAFKSLSYLVEDLIGEAKFLEHKMFDQFGDPLFETKKDLGREESIRDGERTFSGISGVEGITGSAAIRGKTISSFMTKFISRPETTAEAALKDGIALRVTVPKSQMADAIIAVTRWFKTEMRAFGPITFENDGVFEVKKKDEEPHKDELILAALLAELNKLIPHAAIDTNVRNASSAGRFAAFKVTGECGFPEGGNPTSSKVPRRFEIQFVIPQNRNNRGEMDHHIYNVVRRVSAMTRLFGSCAEDIFMKYVAEASVQSGQTQENIIKALTKGKKPRVVIHKARTRHTKPRYIVAVQHERRAGFDIDLGDDPALLSEVTH